MYLVLFHDNGIVALIEGGETVLDSRLGHLGRHSCVCVYVCHSVCVCVGGGGGGGGCKGEYYEALQNESPPLHGRPPRVIN